MNDPRAMGAEGAPLDEETRRDIDRSMERSMTGVDPGARAPMNHVHAMQQRRAFGQQWYEEQARVILDAAGLKPGIGVTLAAYADATRRIAAALAERDRQVAEARSEAAAFRRQYEEQATRTARADAERTKALYRAQRMCPKCGRVPEDHELLWSETHAEPTADERTWNPMPVGRHAHQRCPTCGHDKLWFFMEAGAELYRYRPDEPLSGSLAAEDEPKR